MTWIKTVLPKDADEHLRHCYEAAHRGYPKEYEGDVESVRRPDGGMDSVSAAHSLIPDAMRHALGTFAALMSPDLPLSRRQQEMIATLVSALNQCFY